MGKALKIVGKASRNKGLEMGQEDVPGATPGMKKEWENEGARGSQPHPTLRQELQSLIAIKHIFSQLLIVGVMGAFGISPMHFHRILEWFGLEEPLRLSHSTPTVPLDQVPLEQPCLNFSLV